MIQLLRSALVLPNYSDGEDIFQYMATDFINAVRSCLRGGGYATKEEEREKGGTFLVGFQGQLFGIERDYQIEQACCGYHAPGSGDDLALGALYATERLNLPPEQRIEIALEVAPGGPAR